MSYSTEINRRIYDDKEGTCLEVRPSPDFPSEFIEIHTPNPKSREYYGEIRFSLPKEMAKALGAALIASADDLSH